MFEHDDWWEWGEYDGTECAHCGRQRVVKSTAPDGSDRKTCEKCGWDQELGDYAVMYAAAVTITKP
jgi:ribosomal protein L37AE/L43A